MEDSKRMGLFRKSGGGFLNGENGVITGLKFDVKTWGEGESAYQSLSAELLVQQDGAEEPVQQFLGAGFVHDEQSISDDGTTLEGGLQVGEDTEFARFIQSMIDAGFDVSNFPEDGSNFSAIVSQRVTFAKELNKERQLAAGKKKLGKQKAAAATEEEIMKAGRRQDKTDKKKFYNHDRLIVTAVLGEAPVAAAKGKPKAKPAAAAKPKPAAAAKPAAKPAPAETADSDDATEAAEGALLSILGDAKDNTVPKGSLSSKVVNYALENNLEGADREALRKLVTSEAFLQRQTGWVFDGKVVKSA